MIFISSAGNSAARHDEADFLSERTQGMDLHNFGRRAGGVTDWSMNVTIDPGRFLLVFLQWNDAFGASANDHDLFLINKAATEVQCPSCGSMQNQTGFEDPLEAICTSASAPHFAGVAALLEQRAPGVGAKGIRAALALSAVDLGLPGPDRTYGAGRVNARAALDLCDTNHHLHLAG